MIRICIRFVVLLRNQHCHRQSILISFLHQMKRNNRQTNFNPNPNLSWIFFGFCFVLLIESELVALKIG